MTGECAKDAMFINKITLFNKLAQNGVRLMTNTKVVSVDKDGVHVEGENGETVIKADTVVTAFGMKPLNDVADIIDAKYHNKTRMIGDVYKLGKIGTAIREGYYAGSSIE